MPRLENWVLVLRGDCYEDEKKRFRDGEPIVTSKVVSINLSLKEAQTLNTKYKLGNPKMFPKELGIE